MIRLKYSVLPVLCPLIIASVAAGPGAESPPTAKSVVNAQAAAVEDGIAVFFSPEGGAADAVIYLIGRARQSIRIQSFMFTHKKIGNALIEAHQRGVAVELIMDRKTSRIKGSVRPALRRAGITVYIPPKGMMMHNKVLIIDDSLVITGSFNLTWSADRKNIENLLILHSKSRITKAYLTQHNWLRKRSKTHATRKK